MRPTTLYVMMLALAVGTLSGCNARPDSAMTPSDSAPRQASAATPRVLGACCPGTDAELMAMMQRYEDTAPGQRSAELAMWSFRMNSGLETQERIVVRDSASWAALWPRIVGTNRPIPPLPAVNFASEMLLVVAMGTRNSGGYVTAIDTVSVANGVLRVVVREQSPGPQCGTTAALTAPAALARLERSELPVSFTTRAVVRDCA